MDRTTLDRYKVLRTLGEGGFSKVKMVEDEHNHRYAAKIFKTSASQLSERKEENLLNEVNNLKNIHHPNVLSFIKYQENGRYVKGGREKKVTYLLMELCENGSLFDFVFKNGFMEESYCRFYFRQLLEAVEACHKFGVCHRDIKPENVLFDSSYSLKLADLGFSISTKGRTGTGYLDSEVGTGGYMAPEIYIGRQYKGEKVDIFSLGVVLFIMRSYNPPFIKATLSDAYYRLFVNDENRFWTVCMRNKAPDHFSPEFQELIKGMLAYNPDERLSIQEIKQSSWYNGPFTGPYVLIKAPSGETILANRENLGRVTGVNKAEFSGRMYRSSMGQKTISLFNDDFILEDLQKDDFNLLRYSKILTSLEPNDIISAISVLFEQIKANYSPITPELKIRVTVEDLGLVFKLRFFRYEGKKVIYLHKVSGNEFDFIEIIDKMESLLKDTEEAVNEESCLA